MYDEKEKVSSLNKDILNMGYKFREQENILKNLENEIQSKKNKMEYLEVELDNIQENLKVIIKSL